MSASSDCPAGPEPLEDFLAVFARKLEKHAASARRQLAEIAALPDGPRVYRQMRNSGELPASVVAVLRQLDPDVFQKLEGG